MVSIGFPPGTIITEGVICGKPGIQSWKHLTLAVSRRAMDDVLEARAAIGAVGSSALLGGGSLRQPWFKR
jgi:hypothetical protein